jgi:hypothetical protein
MPDYGPSERELRAADTDREAVAETLRQQHLAGRLDTDELQERIERCYAAKTYAELDALLVDLPGNQPAARPRGAASRVPRIALVPLLPLLIVALAISHGHVLWLILPVAFFFAFVRRASWSACRRSTV